MTTLIIKVPHPPEELKAPKVIDAWTNRINNELNENLIHLDSNDAQTIVSNLKASNRAIQGRHIFFEVVLGGYFARSGYGPRYEQAIDGLTPDWSLTVDPYRAIIEVVNVDSRADVTEKLADGEILLNGNRADKLYDAINEKKNKYKEVAERHKLPFVIAVCPSLAAPFDNEDFVDALLNDGYGIFLNSPHVSGVLLFESRYP